MEMLINVQSNIVGEVVERLETGVILKIGEELKTYSKSTIKRWWKKYAVPTPQTTPQPTSIQLTTQLPMTELAQYIIAQMTSRGCTVKETKSYRGIKYGTKTIMEIHTNKKGNTRIVINSKALQQSIVDCIIDLNIGTKVPDSYGWTLNLKVDADQLAEQRLQVIFDEIVEYVC